MVIAKRGWRICLAFIPSGTTILRSIPVLRSGSRLYRHLTEASAQSLSLVQTHIAFPYASQSSASRSQHSGRRHVPLQEAEARVFCSMLGHQPLILDFHKHCHFKGWSDSVKPPHTFALTGVTVGDIYDAWRLYTRGTMSIRGSMKLSTIRMGMPG